MRPAESSTRSKIPIALQKLFQEVKGQRGIWAKKPVLHTVQQAIELFAESEGFLVVDEG